MFSKWPRSIGHTFTLRLGLWYAGLFIGSALTVGVFTYLLLARALAAQDHDVLSAMLSRYAIEYQRAGLTGLESLIAADAGAGRHERLLVRVVGRRTELVYFAEPPGWKAFDLSRLDQPSALQSGWTTIANPPDGTLLEVGTVTLPGGVTVQVGRSSDVRDELLGNFRARALQVVALVALIAVGGGLLLTYAALTPIRGMEATVRSILQTGRFDARIDTRATRDPLDELGGLVNEMLKRIQSLVAGMRGALDNVAHDLRTPLTRFRNIAETALVSGDPAATREALVLAVEEADRVNATLTALMDISEAETGTMTLAPERLSLARVVEEAVSLHADEAEDKDITLRSAIPEDLQLVGDGTRLRQVLANLIENAVKYTDRGGRIDIEGGAADGSVTVRVRDTGIGIAPADLPFVWDRLYRADASRSTRGLGLGLSLVKAVVGAHGGRVEVSSFPGRGSVFSVVLPAAGPPGEASPSSVSGSRQDGQQEDASDLT